MRIYLAARYSRREELCGYRSELERLGHTVTARWLNGEHQAADDDPGPLAEQFAQHDYDDLRYSDLLINFTEAPRSDANRGGRHVEFGIALGWVREGYELGPQRVMVVGPRENVFHWLAPIEQFDTWLDCRAVLATEARSCP